MKQFWFWDSRVGVARLNVWVCRSLEPPSAATPSSAPVDERDVWYGELRGWNTSEKEIVGDYFVGFRKDK